MRACPFDVAIALVHGCFDVAMWYFEEILFDYKKKTKKKKTERVDKAY